MVDAEAVTRRLLVLNESVGQLSSRTELIDAEALRRDPLLRAATERWLQVAIEAARSRRGRRRSANRAR